MCKNILIPDFLDDDYNIQLCYKPVFQEIYAPVKTNNLVNKTIQKKNCTAFQQMDATQTLI